MLLKLAHINKICDAALSFHEKDLAIPYNEYINKNVPIGNDSYNHEQEEFISRLYPASSLWMPGISQDKLEDDYFLKYDRLNDLFEFIFQVKFLWEKKQNEHYLRYLSGQTIGGIISSFMLPDSRFVGIYQSGVTKTCTIGFTNVITYDEGRLNKDIDVNITDIAIYFMNVSSVRIQGIFRYKPFESYYISEGWVDKISENEYFFSVLSPIDKEGFIIEVIFKDYTIDVKPASFYTKNCLPISI